MECVLYFLSQQIRKRSGSSIHRINYLQECQYTTDTPPQDQLSLHIQNLTTTTSTLRKLVDNPSNSCIWPRINCFCNTTEFLIITCPFAVPSHQCANSTSPRGMKPRKNLVQPSYHVDSSLGTPRLRTSADQVARPS